ncbi:MAG: hypothetical protein ACFFC7_33390 [Candidatus Hermodarchaeota archaeon]
MALFDQEYQLRYNLLFTVIAIIFGISALISLYIGLSGWFFTGWDILGLTAPPNLLSLSVIPLIFWVSSINTFITYKILIKRNLTNIKNIILGGIVISSICGLIMLIMTSFTLGLSFRIKEPDYSIWIDYFAHPFSKIPFLGAFVGLPLGLTLFGIIIAWHSPIPKQTNEIDSWREYIEENPIPWKKLSTLFFFTIWIINFLLPLFLFFIHYFIIPNTITQFFFDDADIFLLIGGISVLFPGPFLYTLLIIILFREPLRMKLNLFLLNNRTEKIPKNNENQALKIQKKQRKQEKQSNWALFGTLTIVEMMFIGIFTFLRAAIWVEVAILSFWSAFFLYSMFFLIQYT